MTAAKRAERRAQHFSRETNLVQTMAVTTELRKVQTMAQTTAHY